MTEVLLVDTNVAKVANAALDADPEWDLPCIQACVNALQGAMATAHIVLDKGGLIVAEYSRQLGHSGMPGLGHFFAKWVFDHQWDSSRCTQVTITPDGDSFAEFPSNEELAEFDLADRKFIAAAVAHGDESSVLQAVDSKWWALRDALAASGVDVTFVCEDTIEALHNAKRK